MAQPRIAVLENPDYDNYTVNTLKRLAEALDVGLIVRFAPYGEVMDWVMNFSEKSINVPTFEEELKSSQDGGKSADTVIVVTMANQPIAKGESEDNKSDSNADADFLIQAV